MKTGQDLQVAESGVRYYGQVISIPKGDGYGFIGIETVTTEDGGTHGIPTMEDIFLHQDDCQSSLYVGMHVSFIVKPDQNRGEGFFRAFGALEYVEGELVPSDGEAVPGFYLVNSSGEAQSNALVPYAPRATYHLAAKEVSAEAVKQVLKNMPMPEIPRGGIGATDEEKLRLLAEMMAMFFPGLAQFHANFNVLEAADGDLDRAVKDSKEDLNALGMEQEIVAIDEEIVRFKGMKATLKMIYDDGLVRPDTVIPIKYLPDLFMAVPVWYFWVRPDSLEEKEDSWRHEDPVVQEELCYFCDLFRNENWIHTFLMFNRRIRSLRMYKGDKVPPFVSRRLRKAVEAFDYVVIATPYHEKAGADWNDLNWLQMIDPYVLGFKKGIPFFFVLARFSDSGLFPLYHDMVADTIAFLKENKGKLAGYDKVSGPYWYRPQGQCSIHGLGRVLQEHADVLLDHFDKGTLFDWLRNGDLELQQKK